MKIENILVLGAGLVGGPIALDLAGDNRFNVTIADLDTIRLQHLTTLTSIKIEQIDVRDSNQLSSLVSNYDYIINAVPGSLGYQTIETLINAKKHVIDIAFMPEDPIGLNELALANDVSVIVDCGVAPGMSNILFGYMQSLLDEIEEGVIYVGGLPKTRTQPWEYKAVFSPADVIEEYTRTARLIENHREVHKPALTDIEEINFPHVGRLEAFNTDGLRSLLYTIKAKNLHEKTLRYPGYVQKIKLLRDTGFLEEEFVSINNQQIRPIDFTSKILFSQWELKEEEVDLTVMRVAMKGRKKGKNLTYTYDLYDEYDPHSKVHSMARTTGYTATSVLRLITEGFVPPKGIVFPEYLGADGDFVQNLISKLDDKDIQYHLHIDHD